MKAQKGAIHKKRRYSEEFKRSLVKDFESGRYSVIELCRVHGLANQSIYDWIYKYSTFNEKGYRVVEMKDSTKEKVSQLEARIKELESAVGRKQMEIDYLEKMIELAGEELNIDIKKNYDTPPSGGSGKTSKK